MNSLNRLLQKLNDSKAKYFELEGQRKSFQQSLEQFESSIVKRKELAISYDKLQKFFTLIGTEEQDKLQRWFEQVVTHGLDIVFGIGVYGFRIEGPSIRGNEIALGFNIIERVGDTDYIRDPYDEMGGGVADVLSFLLQFVIVFLLRDSVTPIIFLDEAMKHLSPQFRPRMAILLRELADKTLVQIFLITHEELFLESADIAYSFSKPEDKTVVERIK